MVGLDGEVTTPKVQFLVPDSMHQANELSLVCGEGTG